MVYRPNFCQYQPYINPRSNQFKSNHSTSTALHNRLQPKQTTRTYNHSSTRHEKSIHTVNIHTQTTPNKHPTHHYQIHRKLHQRTQSIHHIPHSENINTTPTQKWCSTMRRSIPHTLQHIHI